MPFVLIAALLVVSCAKPPANPEDADASFLLLVGEVTKYFQRGTERVSCDRLKELIIQFTEEHDRFRVARQNDRTAEAEEFKKRYAEAIKLFFEYLDSHRLEPSDVIEIREWMAESQEATAFEAKPVAAVSLANQASHAFADSDGQEPRHVLLFSLIDVSVAPARAFTLCIRIPPGSGEEDEHPAWRHINDFLVAPENKTLWVVFREVCTAYASQKARVADMDVRWSESVRVLVKAGDNTARFKLSLDNVMRLSRQVLVQNRLPDYALADRYFDICVLRNVWNLVHQYGDEGAKQEYRSHVVLLQDFYLARRDRVAVRWLNQVLEAPAEPAVSTSQINQKDRCR